MAVTILSFSLSPVAIVDPRDVETLFPDTALMNLNPEPTIGRPGLVLEYNGVTSIGQLIPIVFAAYAGAEGSVDGSPPIDYSLQVTEIFYQDARIPGLQMTVLFTAGEGPTLGDIAAGYSLDDLFDIATELNGEALDPPVDPVPTTDSDNLTFDDDDQLILALAGADTIDAGGGTDTVYGGPGNDSLTGGDGDDLLGGGADDDMLLGGAGHDWIFGAAGNDTAFGGEGRDLLGGAAGNDLLSGEAGDDRIFGAEGNDTLFGGDGADVLGGSTGNDALVGDDGNDALWGAAGQDVLTGDAGNDTLGGSIGNDTLSGGSGNDEIWGAADDDSISGGDDDDFIGGGSGNDSIFGDDGWDEIYGGLGDDTINAGLGNDTIAGGAGDDLMTGGWGDDIFVFYTRTGADFDRITDFNQAPGVEDRLQIFGLSGSTDQERYDSLVITQFGSSTRIEANDHLIDLGTTLATDMTIDVFLFS